MSAHDSRLHAFRPDLADERLRGRIEAERFVAGRPFQVTAAVADLRKTPRHDAGLSTQLLLGDTVRVFEVREGWAWAQSERDGYVGYVADTALAREVSVPTHMVAVPRTFLYPGPNLKLPHVGALSLGASVTVVGHTETRGTRYALLPSGEALVETHLRGADATADDYVAVAESLLATPYLWGGNTGFGIDCSGLVQLAMRVAGHDVLRDSDMQAHTIGTPLAIGTDLVGLEHGDLVFWKGHVAIVTAPGTIIHASGHSMLVSREPLAAARHRIAHLYGEPTSFRRPSL